MNGRCDGGASEAKAGGRCGPLVLNPADEGVRVDVEAASVTEEDESDGARDGAMDNCGRPDMYG